MGQHAMLSLIANAPSTATARAGAPPAAAAGRRLRFACSARRGGGGGGDDGPGALGTAAPKRQGKNYYDLLGVPTSATDLEIRAQYRKLQKTFHPDVMTADLSVDEVLGEMSSDINEAFSTLKDSSLRSKYDRKLKAENGGRMPDGGSLRGSMNGIVGPIRQGRVLMVADLQATAEEAEAEGEEDALSGARRSLVVWVREWSKTLAFSAGMPMPMSLQADHVSGGARLSFVGVNEGEVQTAGALEFIVVPRAPENNTQADEIGAVLSCGLWSAQVRRISFGRELPASAQATEERVLKSFAAALRSRAKRAASGERLESAPWSAGFGLSGIAAAVTQSFIGGIPFFANDDSEAGGLEAYHLKHDLSTVSMDDNGGSSGGEGL